MVPLVLAVAAPAAVSSLPAQARVGVQAGLVSATLGGEDAGSPGSRRGAHVAAFIAFPFSPVFALQTGVGWAQKGIEEQLDPDVTGQIQLSYVQLPVLVRIAIPSVAVVGAHLLAGPVVSFKTGCTVEVRSQQGGDASADCDSPLLGGAIPVKSSDLGLLFGGGLTFLPRHRLSYLVQVAYEVGIKSIDDSNPQFDVKNRAFFFSAAMTFSLGR